MKLNQKGVTLVELIVSFALVAVAIVYFYQTLYTVKNLYSKAQKETNEYVDVNYAYRIIDALYNNLEEDENICDEISNYDSNDVFFNIESCNESNEDDDIEKNGFKEISFVIDDEKHYLYYYISSTVTNIKTYLENNNSETGEILASQISSIYADELNNIEFNGEDLGTGKVWYLDTDVDASRILNCSAGSGPSWCNNNNKVTVDLANRILQVYGNQRDDKYYIVNINETYYLFTNDNSVNDTMYSAGPIIYF